MTLLTLFPGNKNSHWFWIFFVAVVIVTVVLKVLDFLNIYLLVEAAAPAAGAGVSSVSLEVAVSQNFMPKELVVVVTYQPDTGK